MRCTSCETKLDRYVEGTLSPREMRAIGEHLATCEACQDLFAELHVVDALLATTRTPELPPNFTFALMAEARSLPQRTARAMPVWQIVSYYLLATWAAFALAAWKFGLLGTIRAYIAPLTSTFTHATQGISGATTALSPAMPVVVVTALAIFTVDILLVASVIAFYRFVRPHVAARLHPLEVS